MEEKVDMKTETKASTRKAAAEEYEDAAERKKKEELKHIPFDFVSIH